MKNKAIWMLLGAWLLLLLSGCAGKKDPQPQTEMPKVAFLYSGNIDDGGWNTSHEIGRQYLLSKLPELSMTTYQNVKPGEGLRSKLELLGKNGYKIVFATDPEFEEDVLAVAPQYPQTVFLVCGGGTTAANVGTYDGKIYQAWYLSGIAAGQNSNTQIIGCVAPYPTPTTVRDINALALGAQLVHPGVVVKVAWSGSWNATESAQAAVDRLLQEQADVIAVLQHTPAASFYAAKRGVSVISSNTDLTGKLAAEVLTGPTWQWGFYYLQTVQAVINKQWQPASEWKTMAQGVVGLATYGARMNAEEREFVEDKKTEMMNGYLDVFRGPIFKSDGSLLVPAGQRFSEDNLQKKTDYVKNVEIP